jgi:hypothetical protein
MIEATSISETSVNLCETTWNNTPEDGHLYRQTDDIIDRYHMSMMTGITHAAIRNGWATPHNV